MLYFKVWRIKFNFNFPHSYKCQVDIELVLWSRVHQTTCVHMLTFLLMLVWMSVHAPCCLHKGVYKSIFISGYFQYFSCCSACLFLIFASVILFLIFYTNEDISFVMPLFFLRSVKIHCRIVILTSCVNLLPGATLQHYQILLNQSLRIPTMRNQC